MNDQDSTAQCVSVVAAK